MIYKPREDSELLKKSMRAAGRVLDMGTGSGILAIEAAKTANEVVAVDINQEAVEELNKKIQKLNLKNISTLQSDLFQNVKGKFDTILFNPPYLPVEGEDETWSGGKTGRKVIEQFAKQVGNYLSASGTAYIVISSLTGIDETKKLFSENGFDSEIIAKKKVAWEELVVLKIEKCRVNDEA